jgi:hypothetical protein
MTMAALEDSEMASWRWFPSRGHGTLAVEICLKRGARAFAVSGVPGARGYYAAGSGINAVFSDGSYCYLVGAEEPPPGMAGVTTRASMIAAVQRCASAGDGG